MTQLLLDLLPVQPPMLDNFICGRNHELLARLRALTSSGSFDKLYLWGETGSGKTHLLQATTTLCAGRRPVLALDRHARDDDFRPPPGALLIVDDVDQLSAGAQTALFRLFNTAHLIGLSLLLSGRRAPLHLDLREDLRTRIGQTLIYAVHVLDDEQKMTALRARAGMRGLQLDDGLIHYLLTHGRRDLPSLLAILDQLDRTSLERQRQASLPLLKEVLQLQLLPESSEENESHPV